MKKYRAYAEIDLDALVENLRFMKEKLPSSTGIMAVIKTDGYGHGAVEIARSLEELPHIWGYAVATVEEAMELREHQLHKPILVLGYTFEEDYDVILQNDIRPTVIHYEMALALSKAAKRNHKTCWIHLAIDTGMSRIGFADHDKNIEVIKQICELPGLELEGVFTHFARADEADKSYTLHQLERYRDFTEKMEQAGIKTFLKHCSNSAGILEVPQASFNLVRAGISMYGIYPSEEVSQKTIQLKPVMSLKSHIVFLKEIVAGTSVSYGGTFIAEAKMRVATIPVGYGDGYPRSLSNLGYVLVHGQKAPILGRICMDYFMVDVTHIPETRELDEVVLMGVSDGCLLGIEVLSSLSKRFPYEFVCCIGKRIPRIYRRYGEIIM